MKNIKIMLSIAAVLLLAFSNVFAVAKYADNNGSKIDELVFIQINNWRLPITNYGPHGHDNFTGGAGGEWPIGSGHYYIYGAGIWVGGVVEDAVTGEPAKVVSVGYNPNNGQSEMKAGPLGGNSNDTKWKIYTSEDALAMSEAELNDIGWPIDENGNAVIKSIQDTRCLFNDNNEMGIDIEQITYAWNYPSNANIIFVIYEIEAVNHPVDDVYLGIVCDPDIGAAQDDMVHYSSDRNLTYTFNSDPYDANFGESVTGLVGYDFLESPIDPETGEQLGMNSMTIFTLENDPETDLERYNLMAGLTAEGAPRPNGPFDHDSAPDDKRFMQCSGPFDLEPGLSQRIVIGVVAGAGTEGREEITFEDGVTIEIPDASSLNGIYTSDDAAQAIYDNDWLLPAAPVAPNVEAQAFDNEVVIMWDNLPEITPDPYYAIASQDSVLDEETGELIPNGLYDPSYIEYDFQGYVLYKSPTGQPGTWEVVGKWDKADGITIVPDTTYNPDIGGNIIEALEIGEDTGLRYYYKDTQVDNYLTYYYAVTAFDYQLNKPRSIECGRSLSTVEVVPQPRPIGQVIDAAVPADTNITHEGPGDGSIVVNLINPYDVTGHDYKIEFEEDDHGVYWKLVDVTLNEVKLDKQYHQATAETYENDEEFQVVDGIQVKVIGPPAGINSIVELDADGNIYDTNLWGSLNNYGRSMEWPVFFNCADNPEGGPTLDLTRIDRGGYMSPNDYEFIFVDESEASLAWEYYTDSCVDTLGNPYYIPVQIYRTDINGNRMRIPVGWYDENGDGQWDRHRDTPFTTGTGWERFYVYDYVEYDPAMDDTYIEAQGSYALEEPFGWYVNADRPIPAINRYVFGMYIDLDGYAEAAGLELDADGFFVDPPAPGEHVKIITNKPLGTTDSFTFSTGANTPFDAGMASEELDMIKVVPNPFFVRTQWDASPNDLHLMFSHLPEECTIKIYTVAGNLVDTIEHHGGNTEYWNLLTRNDQIPASGVYIYKIDSEYGTKLGKFAIIR